MLKLSVPVHVVCNVCGADLAEDVTFDRSPEGKIVVHVPVCQKCHDTYTSISYLTGRQQTLDEIREEERTSHRDDDVPQIDGLEP